MGEAEIQKVLHAVSNADLIMSRNNFVSYEEGICKLAQRVNLLDLVGRNTMSAADCVYVFTFDASRLCRWPNGGKNLSK